MVYDTVRDKPGTADFMDNHPHVAILRNGTVVLDLDSVSLAPVGPVGFHGMALLPVSHDAAVMVYAFTLGVDESGTFFVLLTREFDRYRIVGTLMGTQAQLRFSEEPPGRFEFWTADRQFNRDPDKQCVWCRKYYKKTTYAWRDGQLLRLRTSEEKQAYQPDKFQQAPLTSMK